MLQGRELKTVHLDASKLHRSIGVPCLFIVFEFFFENRHTQSSKPLISAVHPFLDGLPLRLDAAAIESTTFSEPFSH